MRHFRNFDFLVRKPATAATSLRRCVDVFRQRGVGDALISYQFHDMTHRETSGIDRIRKQFPALDLDVHEAQADPEDTEEQETSDAEPATVDSEVADMLCQVFDGIARRYPLLHASVFIHEIPWSRIDAAFPDAPEAVTFDGPGTNWLGAISVRNDWWISSRMQSMHASIEVPPGADGQPRDLPQPIAALLEELGKPRKGELQAYLSETERAALEQKNERAQQVMARYRDMVAETAARLEFPHRLPHPHSAGQTMGWPLLKIGSYKPALTEVFGVIGYRYESSRSGNGVFKLTKRSPAGHELELSFEIGSYSRSAAGRLRISGEGWFAGATLVVTAWNNAYASYPIVDAEVWRKSLENIRVCVEYYERTFVPEIDAIYRE